MQVRKVVKQTWLNEAQRRRFSQRVHQFSVALRQRNVSRLAYTSLTLIAVNHTIPNG